MDRAHVAIQGVPGLATQESREVTFAKGKKLIEEVSDFLICPFTFGNFSLNLVCLFMFLFICTFQVASQLRINKHCVDTAFNFFKVGRHWCLIFVFIYFLKKC